MRSFFLSTILFALCWGTAWSQDAPRLTVADQSFETFGKRISNSSVVRRATITRGGVRISDSNAYLPAGQVLLVAKGNRACTRLRGKQWCLAVTEDGLPIYVLTNGEHFFRFEQAEGLWVFALTEGEADAGDRTLFYTASERYPLAEDVGDGRTRIVVNTDAGKGFSVATEVDITDRLEDFVFVDSEKLRDPQSFAVIRPVFEGELSARIRRSISDFEFNDETWDNVRAQFENFLIREKECGREVSFGFDLEGALGAEVGKFLSGISAKLKLTATYKDSTSYPANLRFRARRFIQEFPDGSQRFFEVWERIRYSNGNCTEIEQTAITAYDEADFGGERGEITSTSAPMIGLGTSDTQRFPTYSCDREYLRAIRHLTDEDGLLSREAAVLLVTYVMRLDGLGSGIKTCDNQLTG